jgi:predicted nucleotidyltransferase
VYTAILDNLDHIEQQHQVRILYAVESGSRAWGFASRDSDYDVRFIYVHSLDWYLSIRDKRDVIERPISDLLDISGWELRKALSLFRKSNPPLLEWLNSPIIYLERTRALEAMRGLLVAHFSPRRCMLHYLHMAKGNYREYLKGDTVRLKKYFYVLRPVFACMWIERHNSMPPTEFNRLLADLQLEQELIEEVQLLLRRKMAGEELDMGVKVPTINDFLEQQISHYSGYVEGMAQTEIDEMLLDNLFRETLSETWNTTWKP